MLQNSSILTSYLNYSRGSQLLPCYPLIQSIFHFIVKLIFKNKNITVNCLKPSSGSLLLLWNRPTASFTRLLRPFLIGILLISPLHLSPLLFQDFMLNYTELYLFLQVCRFSHLLVFLHTLLLSILSTPTHPFAQGLSRAFFSTHLASSLKYQEQGLSCIHSHLI